MKKTISKRVSKSAKSVTKKAVSKVRVTNQEKVGIILGKFWRWILLPLLIYATIFFIFQPHYLGNFSRGFYLDKGDGYQNVWNIWWVNEALVHRHASPYFTNMVQYPFGTTLVPQTMNIFNGLMAIPLMNVLSFSLIQATNFAVLFSFFVSGLTMFWFIYKLYRKYWVAIIAGGLYTFSSYHFAHGLGHLQLVSMEWIPLFLLAFWTMTEKLRYRDAVFSAVALMLVMMCDYYYLMWCVMLGALWLLWKFYKKEIKINVKTLKVLALFAGLCAVLVGPLMFKLYKLSQGDQLMGMHDANLFSLDPLTVIIPGGSWYWHTLTSWHWTRLPYMSEMSNYFGLSVIVTLILAFFLHRRLKAPAWLNFWWIVLVVFGVLSLGPRFTTFGQRIIGIPLPYAGLSRIMPSLRISGMPVRWILIALIATIVIVSFMLSKLDLATRKGKILMGLFLVVALFDLFPTKLPLSIPDHYKYVSFLKTQPKSGVIDNAALSGAEQLYNQTEHGNPMAFGYVTRIEKKVDEKNFHIFAALEEGRFADLCSAYKIRYVSLPPSRPLKTGDFPVIYQDDHAMIYDMKNSDNC